MKLLDDSANKIAAKGFAKIMAVFIILAVAIFGDTMYAIQMQKIFAGNGGSGQTGVDSGAGSDGD